MKKTITIIAGLMLAATTIKAQTYLADFENLVLPADSFYADTVGNDFTSGTMSFQYDWSQSPWGDYWSGGFVYSNMTDSVTSGYENMYSAKTAAGYNGSANYVVSMNNSTINLTGASYGTAIGGFYITNSTYAYNSMRDGDMFAKKFGGTTGDDPDWFKLVVRSYSQGVLSADSVEFYLADYRFSNNTQDYIVKTWEYVDLSYLMLSLSVPDSLLFTLSSSDNGTFGMNTPAYFCMDNFERSGAVIGMKEQGNASVSLYPNPAKDEINLSFAKTINIIGICSIVDVTGTEVRSIEIPAGTSSVKVDVKDLEKGVYFLRVNSGAEVITKKFIKE
ncbi:MAG TPA: DUF4465 domain-containing protein [Bacteroidia bacterium]